MAYSNPSRQICYYACSFFFSLGECVSALKHQVSFISSLTWQKAFIVCFSSLVCLLFCPPSRVTKSDLLQHQVGGMLSTHMVFNSTSTDTAGSPRRKHVLPHSAAVNSSEMLRTCFSFWSLLSLLDFSNCFSHTRFKFYIHKFPGPKLKITDHTESCDLCDSQPRWVSLLYAKQNPTGEIQIFSSLSLIAMKRTLSEKSSLVLIKFLWLSFHRVDRVSFQIKHS